MSRTVTAMFDSRNEAESARDRLKDSNIEADRVRIVDQQSSGGSSGGARGEEGFWASLKDMFMPDEDRQAYGEGIRRGGFMLIAEVDEKQADQACQLLEQSGSVDFDKRQSEWKSQGQGGDEQHIPIAKEELRVGKREVERGGARVRSYVREEPVHEEISLREEHVQVERRPVDPSMRASEMGEDVFQDREINMTERAEEAVVSKEARVNEEVVISKTSDERKENIDDTLRHTEVDVDEGKSAFGFDRDKKKNEAKDPALERSGANRNRDDGLL